MQSHNHEIPRQSDGYGLPGWQLSPSALAETVKEVVSSASITDLHTHLYAPEFGTLNLWGIDELLNYHYLVAEFFRYSDLKPDEFWRFDVSRRADLIWEALFVENTPLSEATRGVVSVLSRLGLDPRSNSINHARDFFQSIRYEEYSDRVLTMAGVQDVVMTNDPLDESETIVWLRGASIDPRFHAALRLDGFVNDWLSAVPKITAQGFGVTQAIDQQTRRGMHGFLETWIERMRPLYMAISLPDDFAYQEPTYRGQLLRDVVFPICQDHDIPLALMIGVKRQVNPQLKLAGDGLGRADVDVVSRICSENTDIKFLVTFLSRENQHELCVAARKFSNLMPFGCWWFLNNPSIISEITRERIEMLGTSFIPQHSDARILEQLIYKWEHSRRIIADELTYSYIGLARDGLTVTRLEIERDVAKLFSGNFRKWVGLPSIKN